MKKTEGDWEGNMVSTITEIIQKIDKQKYVLGKRVGTQ